MIDMNTAGPLTELGTELRRQLATKRDLIADTQRVSLYPDDVAGVRLGVDMPDGLLDFDVMPHAHGQIAQHLGIDRRFYDRLLFGNEPEPGTRGRRAKRRDAHPDLLAGLVNGLFAREPSKRMLRTMDGKARAFLSNGYRPRDNWDLIEEAVLPVLTEHQGRVVVRRCDLTDTRMYVKVSLPEFELPVTPEVGDVIQGGVIVQNSEVGAGSLVVAPYTTRLICTNGMVHTDMGQSQRHVGKRIVGDGESEAWEMYSDSTLALDDAAFFAKCRDTVRGVLNETVFTAIVAQMRDLANIRVPGAPDAVVEVFAKRHNLRDTERGSMLAALIEGHDLSAWGYVNALTNTATHSVDDADRQVELQKLGGELLGVTDWALVPA